ncbi:MAG TPA: c-type cytochrome [Xanthomonadaceae bacterium]|nr:c-type cytochrome [Xanthomonadaceae bacterium]
MADDSMIGRASAWLARQAGRAWRCLAAGGWGLALCRVVVVVALLGIGGLVFVAAGLMPIAASEGHWAVTRALLQFTMRSSVRTRTMSLDAPPLDDPGLVLKGAGHYAGGCLPCHGAPGEPRSLVVRHMTPEPPSLPAGLGTLRDEELFWIVRHGIKYTAMPAWPAQAREDEVWAMVAFLRALPDMTAGEFRRLAYGDAVDRPGGGADARIALLGEPGGNGPWVDALQDCERCHGADGMGRGDGTFPRLAGLDAAYLEASLRAFAAGTRHSGMMQPVAAGLEPAQVERLATHFAALDAAPAATRCADPAAVARGAALAASGDPARKIPACAGCHAPPATDRNPLYPTLAGQHRDYLALQLRLFRERKRGGTPYAGLMRVAAKHLEDRDIGDLAAYYASLPGDCPRGATAGAVATVTTRTPAGCAAPGAVLESASTPGTDRGPPCPTPDRS